MGMLAPGVLCCLLQVGSAAVLASAGTRFGEEGGGDPGRDQRKGAAAAAAFRVSASPRSVRQPCRAVHPAAAAAGSAGQGEGGKCCPASANRVTGG